MKIHESNKPVISELKGRISEYRSQLLNILEEWHYLQNELQPKLIFSYESHFGTLESELRLKNRIATELDRRVELLSVKLKSGEELTDRTILFIEKIVQKESVRKSNKKAASKQSSPKIPICQVNDKYEIPQIYRKLVKKLHPDVIGEESETYKSYWIQVQTAYKNEDAEKLRLYEKSLIEYEDTEIQDIHREKIKLKTEIRELESNIRKAKNKLESIKYDEPFNLQDRLNDRSWISGKKRYLKEKIFYLDRQIVYKESMLRKLTKGQYIAEKSDTGNVRFIKKGFSSAISL